MTRKERRIMAIIAETLKIKNKEVLPHLYLMRDLGASVSDVLEVISKTEYEFKHKVVIARPNGELADITVAELCRILISMKDKRFSSTRLITIAIYFLGALIGYILFSNLGLWIAGFVILSGLYKDAWDLILYLIASMLKIFIYVSAAAIVGLIIYGIYLLVFN